MARHNCKSWEFISKSDEYLQPLGIFVRFFSRNVLEKMSELIKLIVKILVEF